MLPHHNAGEAVRMHLRLPFHVADLIEFAEGLPDAESEDTFAPALDFLRISRQRMPEPHRLGFGKIDDVARRIERIFPGAYTGALPSLSVAEDPYEPPAKISQQRMINEVLVPMIQRHAVGRQK